MAREIYAWFPYRFRAFVQNASACYEQQADALGEQFLELSGERPLDFHSSKGIVPGLALQDDHLVHRFLDAFRREDDAAVVEGARGF